MNYSGHAAHTSIYRYSDAGNPILPPTQSHCTWPMATTNTITPQPQTRETTETEDISTDTKTVNTMLTMATMAATARDSGIDLMKDSCPSLAVMGGGLGGLCAILAILLVGVVMAWAWSSHRRTGKQR